MPRASRSRHSASYARLGNGSDEGEDENEIPLLSLPEILGDPEANHNHHKSQNGFAPLKRTFTELQAAVVRFYHLRKIAFFISLYPLVAFLLVGLYLRSAFREPLIKKNPRQMLM